MNKKQALKEVSELISYIDQIRNKGRHTHHFTFWFTKVKTFITDIYGEDSNYNSLFDSIGWTFTGQAITQIGNYESVIERKQNEAFGDGLEASLGMLLAMRDSISKTSNIADLLEKDKSTRNTSTISNIDEIWDDINSAYDITKLSFAKK